MAEGHNVRAASWVVVGLICAAAIVLGFAFVAQSIPLAIVGGVLGVVGLVTGAVTGIMNDAY